MTDFFLIFAFLSLTANLWLLFLITKKMRISKSESIDLPGVSVIIALKNEEKNVPKLIQSLNELDYPKDKLEIILVDDYSDDNTLALLTQNKKNNFLILNNKNNPSKKKGKKSALTYGIENSNNEYLFFTDADCQPPSEWIKTTLNYFLNGADLVYGYAPFIKERSLLNNLIQYENCKTTLLMEAFHNAGYPYMCFGRNLAYRKSLFNKLNGFELIEKSLSGDDDLFLQLATKINAKISFNDYPNSIVFSSPYNSIKDFFRKKIRHTSAGKFYNKKYLSLLSIYHNLNFLNSFGAIISIVNNDYFLLPIFLIPIFITTISLKQISNELNIKNSFIVLFLIETFSFIYYTSISLISLKKKIKW